MLDNALQKLLKHSIVAIIFWTFLVLSFSLLFQKVKSDLFVRVKSFVLFVKVCLYHFLVSLQYDMMLELVFVFLQLFVNQKSCLLTNWQNLRLTTDDYFLLISWSASLQLFLLWFYDGIFKLFIPIMLVFNMGVDCRIW